MKKQHKSKLESLRTEITLQKLLEIKKNYFRNED